LVVGIFLFVMLVGPGIFHYLNWLIAKY